MCVIAPITPRQPIAPREHPLSAISGEWPLTCSQPASDLTNDWACQQVVENQDQMPGRDSWLLVRRSLTKPHECAYFLSNAPPDTALLTLAQVASTRYTIEQCFEEAKGETGLDHYQVRYWPSWYRHITLSMMAHVWLAWLRLRRNQKKGGLNPFWPS